MFRTPLVVLDFETSGMSPEHGGRVTEVAAIRIEGDQLTERFVSLVNADVTIPSFITQLTGITQAMVDQAPSVDEVIPKLIEFIGEDYLVAHNASFDEKFLFAEAELCQELPRHRGTICSVKLARRLRPGFESYSLGPLALRLGIKFSGRAHRAEADAEVTAHLMLNLGQHLIRSHSLQNARIDGIDPELLVQVTRLKATKVPSYIASWCTENEAAEATLHNTNAEKNKVRITEPKEQGKRFMKDHDKSNVTQVNMDSHKPVRFRHYKGGIYELVGEATQESDLSPVIVYRSHDGSMWTRPRAVFFEMLDIDGRQVQRFTQIEE